ncbi:MAG: hypothetical protein AB1782_07970 [Cyanobacteriota bacterium]
MEKLYELNKMLAKVWKLGKLQAFVYPAICFALLAAAIILIAILQYIEPLLG